MKWRNIYDCVGVDCAKFAGDVSIWTGQLVVFGVDVPEYVKFGTPEMQRNGP